MRKIFSVIKERFWEILPGFITWATFILSVAVSFWKPIWAIYFIIVFDLLWLVKIYYLVIHQISSWIIFRREVKKRWIDELAKIQNKDWRNYWHLVFLPTYKETYEILNKTFQSLSEVDYPKDRMIIVLAGEERDEENFSSISKKIYEEYGSVFYKILITTHPKNLHGEVPGKGSNINYAGHESQKFIDGLNIAYENIIVSSFDIDTRPHAQYFSYLTYKYLTAKNPTRISYQPIALYHNNIWESDPLTRVVANSTTFWLMTDLARSDRLFTFSSHSMSFKALVDVGFWEKDIVSEDSRIFLQCLFRYDGDYRVEPLYIPVSMNTVNTGAFWKAMQDQYKQMRRWAWGAEHIPYMAKRFKLHPNMPARIKIKHFFNQFEGIWTWATAPILITIMGRLPLWVASKSVHATVFAQTAPLILEKLMTLALIGLIINAFLSTILLPHKKGGAKWWHYPQMILEWVLFPITMVVFGSIPATESQTRLMLGGKYRLGFWVSGKK